jgi:hypothetical protein
MIKPPPINTGLNKNMSTIIYFLKQSFTLVSGIMNSDFLGVIAGC